MIELTLLTLLNYVGDNFSSEARRYSGTFSLKFQTNHGTNIGLSATSLASPSGMKEAGFHIQKTIFSETLSHSNRKFSQFLSSRQRSSWL